MSEKLIKLHERQCFNISFKSMDRSIRRDRRISSAVSSSRLAGAPISYECIPSTLDATSASSRIVGGGGSVELSETDLQQLRDVHIVEEKEDFAQRLAATRGDFHFFIVRLVDHRYFNGFIMFIILFNTITLGIESTFVTIARDTDSDMHAFLNVCDGIFVGVYTVEFLLKFIARPLGYWQNSFNWFDFLILALSVFDLIANVISTKLQNIGFVKVFRVFRALRALRTASFVRGLQIRLTALVTAIKSSLSVCLLLFMVIFVFDVLGIYLFGNEGESTREYFRDFNQGFLSLMTMVTADGWTDMQSDLDNYSQTTRIFSLIFLLFGNFIFTNIFIAIIINNVQDADEQYRAEVAAELAAASREKKQRILERKEQELKHMHLAIIREQKSQFHNYDDLLKNVDECVKEHDSSPVNAGDFSLNLLWVTSLLTSLDHYDNITCAQSKLYQEMALLLATCYELRHDEHEEAMRKREEEHAAAMAAAFPAGMNNSNMLKLFGAAMLQAGRGGGVVGGNSKRTSLSGTGGRRKAGSVAYPGGLFSTVGSLHNQSVSPTLSVPGVPQSK